MSSLRDSAKNSTFYRRKIGVQYFFKCPIPSHDGFCEHLCWAFFHNFDIPFLCIMWMMSGGKSRIKKLFCIISYLQEKLMYLLILFSAKLPMFSNKYCIFSTLLLPPLSLFHNQEFVLKIKKTLKFDLLGIYFSLQNVYVKFDYYLYKCKFSNHLLIFWQNLNYFKERSRILNLC